MDNSSNGLQSNDVAFPESNNKSTTTKSNLGFCVRDGVSHDLCVTMGILGLLFLPIGFFGISDFIVGRWRQGIVHLVLIALSIIPPIFSRQYTDQFVFFSTGLFVANGIFAIYESIRLLFVASKSSVRSTNATVSEANTAINNNDMMTSGFINEQNETHIQQNEEKNNKTKVIIALVIAVFNALIWIWMIVTALQYNGNLSDDAGGATIWLIGFYYIGLGAILTILSYVFASSGLKTKYRKLATITLVMHLVTFIEIILFFVITSNSMH